MFSQKFSNKLCNFSLYESVCYRFFKSIFSVLNSFGQKNSTNFIEDSKNFSKLPFTSIFPQQLGVFRNFQELRNFQEFLKNFRSFSGWQKRTSTPRLTRNFLKIDFFPFIQGSSNIIFFFVYQKIPTKCIEFCKQ
jgi:hypothetical protein